MRAPVTLRFRRLSLGMLALAAAACGSEILVVEDGGGAGGSGTGAGATGGAGTGASGTGGGGTCTPGLEICDDKDNDCDGLIDEDVPGGCSCSAGQTQVCYAGPPGTLGLGICKAGSQSCDGGTWGPCEGQVLPQLEVCNGVDDDCDGLPDDVNNDGELCFTGLPGECEIGELQCVGTAPTCVPIVQPSPEVCDGLDNDCNGVADEGDPNGGTLCNTGLPGICGPGVTHCVDGGLTCQPTQAGQPEVCNALDDDCDGIPDDGNPGGGAACSTGLLGVCAAGTTTCAGGGFICQQNTMPSPEICGNAVDEDCDGSAPAAPTVYFDEDFSDNAAGWTLGPEWGIGPAAPSFCNNGATGDDPAQDHTPTADNGVAGVVIGGCYTQAVHGDFCLTSPSVDLSSAAGSVILSFWRHAHADYPPFINTHVDVSSNGGGSWLTLWSNPSGQFLNDLAWTQQTFDVTAQKSATFRMRFCYSGSSQGIFVGGGWSLDDVQLADATCN
jgi:hypothetical protein